MLEPDPARPEVVAQRVREYGVTLFFASERSSPPCCGLACQPTRWPGCRLAASAGEALPAALYQRWTGYFGVDILDGLGMTEMLHIFLSNREGQVRPGTTGVAVPGYELKILDETGMAGQGQHAGTLFVRGESAATGYWSRYEASRLVFQGEWLRTGDTYIQDTDGYYICLGRTGDMLKASGVWVSPAEVEERLLAHEAVAQAIVVAGLHPDGLEKPVAYVVLRPGAAATEAELIEFCRASTCRRTSGPAGSFSPMPIPPPPPARSAASSCGRWPRPSCVPQRRLPPRHRQGRSGWRSAGGIARLATANSKLPAVAPRMAGPQSRSTACGAAPHQHRRRAGLLPS